MNGKIDSAVQAQKIENYMNCQLLKGLSDMPQNEWQTAQCSTGPKNRELHELPNAVRTIRHASE